MKQTLSTFILGVTLFLAGCSAASRLESSLGTKYRYSYFLLSPSPTGRLSYADERIKILFRIDDGAIRFKLSNLSLSTMTVDWSNAFVAVQGRSYPIRTIRSYYSQDTIKALSAVVLPKGYVVEMAIPASNVSYDGSKWQEKDLLPTTDRHSEKTKNQILSNKGGTVDLLLPIRFEGSEAVTYTFRFKASSVAAIPWERYRKPWRPAPPKPVNPIKVTTNDQLITAAIIAGVLGISAILLTQKKSPTVE